MGFDKAKAVRAAEKSLAQGKISAAIQEYRRIVEHDPDDFTALNTLGDLYAREGRKQEAVVCFTRAAEHYRDQGFTLKAIAMYKKVLRLAPDTVDCAKSLATLYEKQGHMVEARAQYLVVADAYTRAGQTREVLSILRRLADLDPNNTEIRLRLADSLMQEGLQDKAAEAYIEAGDRLVARGEYDTALEAYTTALSLYPQNHAGLQGLVAAHAALGTSDEAAEVLVQAVSGRPNDVELRAMLSRAYLDAENAPAAERATAELVNLDPKSYRIFLDVTRLYLQQNNVEDAVSVLARIAELALSSREEGAVLELLHEALSLDPEQIDALRLLVRIHTWQRDDESLRAALERMAEVAEVAGLEDQERGALSQLVRLAPDEPRFRARLQELGGELDSFVLVDEPPSVAFHEEEVPTFESFMTEDAFSPSASSASGKDAGGPMEFEWNAVTPPPPPAPPSDPGMSFADLNDLTDASASYDFEAPRQAVKGSGDFQEVDLGHSSESFQEESFQEIDFGAADAETPHAYDTMGSGTTSDSRLASVLAQELESVDFYIAQGYTDIARDTLDMLERQFGKHADIEARRRRLHAEYRDVSDAPAEVAAPEPVEETLSFDAFASFDIVEESQPAAPVVEQSDAFIMGTVDNALPAGGDQSFQTTEPIANGNAANAQPTIDPAFAALFEEFSEMEEEPPPVEDYETHYNMGLAYREMGLLDQAIEEFQVAAGVTSPTDGTSRYLQCCNLLGHCFLEKGLPRAAAIWFKKGLDSPGQGEDEYQALRYELGSAYEMMGDIDRAIDVFTEVYGINISYRGVAEKLRELQAQRAAK